jgi:hypothetical protein
MEEMEGEELLAPRGRVPHLDKLTDDDGDGDKLAVGAEADDGGGFLEGDAVEDGAAAGGWRRQSETMMKSPSRAAASWVMLEEDSKGRAKGGGGGEIGSRPDVALAQIDVL